MDSLRGNGIFGYQNEGEFKIFQSTTFKNLLPEWLPKKKHWWSNQGGGCVVRSKLVTSRLPQYKSYALVFGELLTLSLIEIHAAIWSSQFWYFTTEIILCNKISKNKVFEAFGFSTMKMFFAKRSAPNKRKLQSNQFECPPIMGRAPWPRGTSFPAGRYLAQNIIQN